ncbi:unnamed protein product, partial [marine sediment metagenome]
MEITISQILKETSEIIKKGNGNAIKIIEKYQNYKKTYPGLEEQFNHAIIILKHIIDLKEKLEKANSKKEKYKFKSRIIFFSIALVICLMAVAFAIEPNGEGECIGEPYVCKEDYSDNDSCLACGCDWDKGL